MKIIKSKKRLRFVLATIIILILVALTFIIYNFSKNSPVTNRHCPNLTVMESDKVDPKSVPSKNAGRNCPNGDYAKEKWIHENRDMVDAGWSKFIYCERDKLFWIVIQPGLVVQDEYGSMVFYYGPFEGEPCFIEKY